jgi:hypothetical protein
MHAMINIFLDIIIGTQISLWREVCGYSLIKISLVNSNGFLK